MDISVNREMRTLPAAELAVLEVPCTKSFAVSRRMHANRC